MNRTNLMLAGWALVCATGVAAAPFTAEHARKVDAAVSAEKAKQQAVGVAIGIIRGGRIVHLRGFGWADREAQIPVTTNTMFRWASISKSVTTVAALQLWEAGQLQLTDDVRQYVPEFPARETPVTIEHLLRNQGGIVHYRGVVRTKRLYHVPHPFGHVTLALDRFRETPPVSAPGQRYYYSTKGFMLLSAAIERAGRQRFADQVEQRICRPLGMTTMQPDYQWRDIPHRAKGYLRRDGKIIESNDTDVSWKLGGGGYISTIGDLARFGVGLLGDQVLHPATKQEMWTVKHAPEGKPENYALGFRVSGEGRNFKVYHGGSQEKTKTILTVYPNVGFGVAVMSNTHHANPTAFREAIVQALF